MLCVGNDVTERKLAEEKLAALSAEKEVMLKEIHHRVKNNLQIIASLLNIQAHYARDEGAAEVLSECHNRVRSMALVHESLYSSENLAKVNFARYVSRLAESLFSSFGVDNQKIKLDLDLDDVLLSIDRAIPCGLIVNELVSNCLKHAFPGDRNGTIEIKLKRLGADDVLLNVKDDGVGVPQGLDPQKTQTLGLKLVSDLTRQIKGTFRFTSSAGTDMAITFPV
jgi:two-component sensor histidine kinase